MRVQNRTDIRSPKGGNPSTRSSNPSSQSSNKSKGIYHLETLEQRMLLSAALPASWAAHPAIYSPALSPFFPVPAKGSANPSGARPQSIVGAYGMGGITFGSVAGDGTGQTIAIIVAYDDPTAAADLTTFDTRFNIAAPPSFSVLNDQGLPGPLPGIDPAGKAPAAGNWEEEASIDVQWTHAMAPGANIILFEASNAAQDLFTTAGRAAATFGVSVVSMSWSGAETADEAITLDPTFTTPAGHTGITFVAAAGDYGIYAQGGAVVTSQYPAASPNVVAVGGTQLSTSGNAYAGETAWGNDVVSGTKGGGGGGISLYEPQSAYQSFLASGFSSTNRTYPDVALEADPASGVAIVDSYDYGTNNPWAASPVGGTSVATSLFAGEIALANQGRVINGFGTLTGAGEALPRIYNLPAADFHDVSSGSNGLIAGIGYDLATGRGSPAGPNFITDLASNFVGSHVFLDNDLNGQQTAGENTGVAGITVSLRTLGTDNVAYTGDDVTVASTITDSQGFYEFVGVTPIAGLSYYVNFATPTGYQISTQVTNMVAGNENVADPVTGNTPVFNVAVTTENYFENAGVYLQTITITPFVSVLRPHSGLAPMVFTVTLAPVNLTTTDVPYTTMDGSATVANSDYLATSGTLVFPPNVTSETITVDAIGNLTIENDVSYYVDITVPGNRVVAPGGTSIGTGLIQNDNFPVATISAPPPQVRSASVSLIDIFTVNLSAPAPFTVNVDYSTVDFSALAGVDYTAATGTLVFPPTITSETLYVTILPGTNRQLDKVFDVQLSQNLPVSATIGTPSEVPATILTNFPPAISASDASVTESLTGTTYLPFNVAISPSLTGTVTVDYTTSDVTAHAGVDYQSESGTLTFNPGRLINTVYVPVPQQFIPAQSKTLQLTLSNASGNIIIVNPIATGTINYLALANIPFHGATRATSQTSAVRPLNAVYIDALGQRVVISLRGAGDGEVVFLGSSSIDTNAYEILLDASTSATSIATISVAHNGQTAITNFIDSGAIGTVNGRTLNIVSQFSVAGSANALNLGFLQGTTLSIGGIDNGPTTALTLGRVVNSSISSTIPIRKITSGDYLDTSGSPIYITAPRVGAVHVRGNFGATIQTATLQSLNVTGVITGGAIASSSIGSVIAGGIANSIFFAGLASGTTTLPTLVSQFVNPAGNIESIRTRGIFSNALIAAATISDARFGDVPTSPGAATFGLSATQFGKIRTVVGPSKQVVSLDSPVTSTTIDNFVISFV